MKLRLYSINLLILLLFSSISLKSISQVTDKDGNEYETVKIGKQEWMASNLNVGHFRNGDEIPQATTEEEWHKAGVDQKPAWCYYDFKSSNGAIYGKLYNWYAVNDRRGLAPKGWKVPDEDEWNELINKTGGSYEAGKKLKAASGWQENDAKGTNESGFSALPGGHALPGGSGFGFGSGFVGLQESGNWWTSFGWKNENAVMVRLHYFKDEVTRENMHKNRGLSVRCIKK